MRRCSWRQTAALGWFARFSSEIVIAAVLTTVVVSTGGFLGAEAMSGPVIGQFEIKTLDVELGGIELQSQNAWFLGNPARQVEPHDGRFLGDGNTISRQRHGLEIEVGLSKFLKTRLGVEFEKERRDDISPTGATDAYGELEAEGFGIEGVLVLMPRAATGGGLGVVIEYDQPFVGGGVRTFMGGPIVEWASGPLALSFNPTLTQLIGGERDGAGQQDEKIDFSYTARALYRWSETFAAAVEAYGTVERIGGSGARSLESKLLGDFDQHRLGPVLYWTLAEPRAAGAGSRPDTEDGAAAEGPQSTLGVGLLFGLTDSTPAASLKLSLEQTF